MCYADNPRRTRDAALTVRPTLSGRRYCDRRSHIDIVVTRSRCYDPALYPTLVAPPPPP